jgi:hypothetical protein
MSSITIPGGIILSADASATSVQLSYDSASKALTITSNVVLDLTNVEHEYFEGNDSSSPSESGKVNFALNANILKATTPVVSVNSTGTNDHFLQPVLNVDGTKKDHSN